MTKAEQPHESLALGPNEHLLKIPRPLGAYSHLDHDERRRQEMTSAVQEMAAFFDVDYSRAKFYATTYSERHPGLAKDETAFQSGAEIWRKAQVERPGFGALIIECAFDSQEEPMRIWINENVRPLSEQTIALMGRYASEHQEIRPPYIVDHLSGHFDYATPLAEGLRQTSERMNAVAATSA